MDANTIQAALSELQDQQKELLSFLRSQPTPQPDHILPDPEKYTGSEDVYEIWLASMEAKLQIDGKAIGDSQAQFYYVFFNIHYRVQYKVFKEVEKAERLQEWDVSAFLEEISHVFGPKEKVPDPAAIKAREAARKSETYAGYYIREFKDHWSGKPVRKWKDKQDGGLE